MLFAMNVAGQETASKDSGDPQRSKMDLVKKKLHQVQAYLDSSAMRKVDARYIEVPKKPWRVDLRYKSTAFDVDYHNSIADPTSSERFDWKLCFEPPLSGSIGVW